MNREVSLSLSLDRQVKKIQFRIQQEISITDDEIQRMSEQLTEYKSEIVRKEKTLNKIERDLEDAKASKEGVAKRIAVNKKLQITQIKNDFHLFIQDLRKQQEEEISALQDQFEEKLISFENMSNDQIEQKYEQIDKEIENLRSEIARNTTVVSRRTNVKDKIKAETTAHCQVLNNNLVIQLRSIIQSRNQERAENLRMSKEKLMECVETIEDLDKEHESAVSDRRNVLSRLDKVYEKELRKLAQAQDHKLLMLKGHLLEAEKRTQILRRAAHKLEQSNELQLHETMKEIDMMHVQDYSSATYKQLSEEQAKSDVLIQKREELKGALKEREEALEHVRAENSQIKKSIAQLKHEIRFASNRAERDSN